MKQDIAEQFNEFNFRTHSKKLQKLNSIIESEEEEEKIRSYKENRPVKNSVQFENNIIFSSNGYDNKSFVKELDQSAYDFKPRNKNEKKADPISNATVRVSGYSDRLKNILFGIICINYLFYGFANNLIGSTLPQIREHLKVSNKEILSSFTVRYSSYFIFNLLTIYTFRRARQYQYCLGVLFYSSVFFIIPSVKDYRQFMGLFAVLGAGNVLMDSIPILLTVEMFQEKSKFYSQVMFVFFAFGGFLGPVVGSQFVASSPTTVEEFAMGSMNSNSDFNPTAQYYPLYNIFDVFFHHNITHHHHASIAKNNSTIPLRSSKSNIHIPFYLIATLFSIVLVIQTLIQFFYPYEKPRVVDLKRRSTLRVEPYIPVEELPLTEEECEKVEKEDPKLPNYYKKSVIVCFCVVLLCFNSIDQTLSLFLSTYLNGRSELEIPLNVQSSFYSYLAITNTLGKLCSLVLIFYIPQKTYLFMNWMLILTGIILMNFVTVNQIYLLKISLLMIGAGISSTYPLVFTLANKRVLITSKTQTIFLFAIVSQLLYLPILFGHFSERGYPKIFNLFLNTFSSLALFAMVIFHLIDLKRTSFLRNINSNTKLAV